MARSTVRKVRAAGRQSSGDISADEIASLHDGWTRAWHEPRADDAAAGLDTWLELVREQHRRNFDLWHQEDKARAPSASDTEVAAVKRRIDRLNQERSDFTERLDATLVTRLRRQRVRAGAGTRWNSETPGSIVDRLSILSLRIYHMREEEGRGDAAAGHRAACRTRRRILERQRLDLVLALRWLLQDLFAGRRALKAYRHFKMYNDPDLNPVLYGSKGAR